MDDFEREQDFRRQLNQVVKFAYTMEDVFKECSGCTNETIKELVEKCQGSSDTVTRDLDEQFIISFAEKLQQRVRTTSSEIEKLLSRKKPEQYEGIT